jgi:hypothetical protein
LLGPVDSGRFPAILDKLTTTGAAEPTSGDIALAVGFRHSCNSLVIVGQECMDVHVMPAIGVQRRAAANAFLPKAGFDGHPA